MKAADADGDAKLSSDFATALDRLFASGEELVEAVAGEVGRTQGLVDAFGDFFADVHLIAVLLLDGYGVRFEGLLLRLKPALLVDALAAFTSSTSSCDISSPAFAAVVSTGLSSVALAEEEALAEEDGFAASTPRRK